MEKTNTVIIPIYIRMNNDKCTRRNEVDWHQEIEIKKKDTMRK